MCKAFGILSTAWLVGAVMCGCAGQAQNTQVPFSEARDMRTANSSSCVTVMEAVGLFRFQDIRATIEKNVRLEVPFLSDPPASTTFSIRPFLLQASSGKQLQLDELRVWLHPDTDVPVKAVWEQNRPSTAPPFPEAAAYRAQMERTSERFVDWPQQSPEVTLVEALGKARGGIASADMILVYHVVMRSIAWDKPRPVWVVHLWGIEPFLPMGGPAEAVPIESRNHLRTIVDAQTGEFYSADTIPQPTDVTGQ